MLPLTGLRWCQLATSIAAVHGSGRHDSRCWARARQPKDQDQRCDRGGVGDVDTGGEQWADQRADRTARTSSSQSGASEFASTPRMEPGNRRPSGSAYTDPRSPQTPGRASPATPPARAARAKPTLRRPAGSQPHPCTSTATCSHARSGVPHRPRNIAPAAERGGCGASCPPPRTSCGPR